jgi:hypothetical protein
MERKNTLNNDIQREMTYQTWMKRGYVNTCDRVLLILCITDKHLTLLCSSFFWVIRWNWPNWSYSYSSLLMWIFFSINLLVSNRNFYESNSSYNLRTNNVFSHLEMPSSPPIPLLGKIFNVMRKVLSFMFLFRYILMWHSYSFRDHMRTMWILFKNMIKS